MSHFIQWHRLDIVLFYVLDINVEIVLALLNWGCLLLRLFNKYKFGEVLGRIVNLRHKSRFKYVFQNINFLFRHISYLIKKL